MTLLIISLVALYGIGMFVMVRGLAKAPEGYEGQNGFVSLEAPELVPVPVRTQHTRSSSGEPLSHGLSHAA